MSSFGLGNVGKTCLEENMVFSTSNLQGKKSEWLSGCKLTLTTHVSEISKPAPLRSKGNWLSDGVGRFITAFKMLGRKSVDYRQRDKKGGWDSRVGIGILKKIVKESLPNNIGK